MNQIKLFLKGTKMKNSKNKMKADVKILTFFLVLFLSQNCFSQNLAKTFDLRCGAVLGQDFGKSIINRIEGGYAIAGDNSLPNCNPGGRDWMFLKTKSNGMNDGAELIGTSSPDTCYSLVQLTNDSGYVLAGTMYDGIDDKPTIVKLRKDGNFLYSKTLGSSAGSFSQVITDTANNQGLTGYCKKNISATTYKKIIVSQYTSAGGLNWAFRYDAYNITAESKTNEAAYSICLNRAGGQAYGIAAKTNFYSGSSASDIMLMKLDYSGAVIWKKVYRLNIPNLAFYPNTEPRKIIPMADGGFVVAGFTNAYAQSESDIFVLRVNSGGGIMWSRTYGKLSWIEYGNSIIADGNYLVITGYRFKPTGPSNAFLMKISINGGAPVWTRLWDKNNPDDKGFDLVKSSTSAPGYVVTGNSIRGLSEDVFLWRTNTNGLISGTSCNDSANLDTQVNPHKLDSFNIMRVALTDLEFAPMISTVECSDNLVCSSDSPTGFEGESINESTQYSLEQNYPNPFNPVTKIRFEILQVAGRVKQNVVLKVFDLSGKEVGKLVDDNLNSGSYEVEFDGSNFSSGIYFYRLSLGDNLQTKQMILLK